VGGRGKGIGGNSRQGSFESIGVFVDPGSENTVSAVGTVLLSSLNAGTLQFAILTVNGLMNLSPFSIRIFLSCGSILSLREAL
jgi:hypothetical protein